LFGWKVRLLTMVSKYFSARARCTPEGQVKVPVLDCSGTHVARRGRRRGTPAGAIRKAVQRYVLDARGSNRVRASPRRAREGAVWPPSVESRRTTPARGGRALASTPDTSPGDFSPPRGHRPDSLWTEAPRTCDVTPANAVIIRRRASRTGVDKSVDAGSTCDTRPRS
jgi:hypothetical protein